MEEDDADGDKTKYVFDWGDGTLDETVYSSADDIFAGHIKHSYDSSGKYTITVTVYDQDSETSAKMTVVVKDQSLDYTVVIILGSIIAVIILLSLILVKIGKFPKLGKK